MPSTFFPERMDIYKRTPTNNMSLLHSENSRIHCLPYLALLSILWSSLKYHIGPFHKFLALCRRQACVISTTGWANLIDQQLDRDRSMRHELSSEGSAYSIHAAFPINVQPTRNELVVFPRLEAFFCKIKSLNSMVWQR